MTQIYYLTLTGKNSVRAAVVSSSIVSPMRKAGRVLWGLVNAAKIL